jgi:hypothetical protein
VKEFTMSLSASHPEDLASGRVISPGESVKLTDDELKEPHNKRLIDEGVLLEKQQAKKEPEPKGEGNNKQGDDK